MKHVIVIETADEPSGCNFSEKLQAVLLRALEIGIKDEHGVCFVHGRFNQQSAIAAVHEMYGAPAWRGGTQ